MVDSNLRTTCIEELKHAKVCNLMTSEGTCDEELVQDIFHTNDVHRIMSIPISPIQCDSWFWKGDLRSMYTVKHGYHLLTRALLTQESSVMFVEWNRLWSLLVPPRIKNLVWRCMCNILPVREVLKLKRVWI